jgi:hypothetical protein
MERSEELYKELREIELAIKQIREKKIESLRHPDMMATALSIIAGEYLLGPNDSHVLELAAKVNEKKQSFFLKEKELRARGKKVFKELHDLTAPVIEKGIQELGLRLQGLPKLEEKVIDTESGGFSMKPRVRVMTNADGLIKAKETILNAIKTLRTMDNEAISNIEAFVQGKLEEIKAVDLSLDEKTIDRFEFERSQWLTSPARP